MKQGGTVFCIIFQKLPYAKTGKQREMMMAVIGSINKDWGQEVGGAFTRTATWIGNRSTKQRRGLMGKAQP